MTSSLPTITAAAAASLQAPDRSTSQPITQDTQLMGMWLCTAPCLTLCTGSQHVCKHSLALTC